MSDRVKLFEPEVEDEGPAIGELEQLLAQPIEQQQPTVTPERIDGIVLGTLVAFLESSQPLVIYPGQSGTAALVARAAVDLCADHIGDEVTLMFENGDPLRPIVTGRIRALSPWPTSDRPVSVEADADGRRVVIAAREQLVLKCGKATITLTASGKVLVQGAYVSQQSSGAMRIVGGSVQIN